MKLLKSFSKTQDLETSAGTVYLVNEDPNQLQKDVEFLRSIEKRAFQLVLSEELHDEVNIEEDKISSEIESLINDIKAYGNCLLVSESIIDNLETSQVLLEDLDGIKGKFDCIVVNLNRSISNKKDDETVRIFLNIFNKVKVGGLIFIPQTTYDFMPNSRLGAEALLTLLDFKIELPIHKLNRMVIASKE
ncbi:hypothetical protein [Methanobrevibacter sp.]|uniref:hypothetical protein n=1 Tax=Methanobrevibacter sp. TaxID=66852 RepID=UPI003891049E